MQKIKSIGAYEAFINAMGHVELKVNGNQSICPFAGSFPVRAQQSQLAALDTPPQLGITGFARLSCTTGCPMAECFEDGDLIKYTVYCGGQPKTMEVTFDQALSVVDDHADGEDGAKI